MTTPNKKINWILFFVAIYISVSSIEVLMRAKDIDLFLAWQNSLSALNPAPSFSEYVTILLLRYVKELFIPIFFSIYFIFIFKKIPFTKLNFVVWNLLLLSALIVEMVKFEYQSIFYYGKIFCFLAMMFANNSLYTDLVNQRERRKYVE